MAIKIKRSTTASSVPPSLVTGEIAINEADGKLYYRASTGTVTQFGPALFAALSHSHAASDITSGTIDIARIPTGSSSSTVCIGNDARLSDTRTPTDGSVTTAKIANDAVTYAKIQNVSATSRILGRSSAGAGDVEELDAATARTVLGVQPTASPAFTGTFAAATSNFSGTVTVTSPLVLTGTVAGNVRQLRMQTSGSTRWEVGPGFDAESGSNVGSTFWITRWSDAGAFLGTPISIARATGVVTFESQVLVTAGGTSPNYAPGIAFTNDTNTGIHQVSGNSDTLSIVTGGTERVRVDASGNVGIGNPSAQARLHCFTASDGAQAIFSGAQSSNEQTLLFRNPFFTNNASAGLAAIGWIDTGASGGILTLKTTTNGGGVSGTPTERVRVKSTGSVRFVPLSADPASGNEAGDVYYNSSTNKLRVYNGTSWVDLH